MTDISIIGTGCLIVALVIAAGIVARLRRKIADLRDSAFDDEAHIEVLRELLAVERRAIKSYRAAEAKRQANARRAGELGRKAQAKKRAAAMEAFK